MDANITPLVRRQMEEEPEEEVQTRAIPKSSNPIRTQQELDGEEDVQTSPFLHRQGTEEEEVQAKTPINRQETEDEEIQASSFLQSQESEEEEKGQTKREELSTAPQKQGQKDEDEVQTTLNAGSSASIQKQSESNEEEETVQSKNNNGSTSEITPETESKIKSQKGGGQPLSDSTRAFFEPRFGQDFSSVRVHTDHKADESTKSINAQAYTSGNDIVFSQGRYSPDTESGKRLLGHELTHFVQQGSTSNNMNSKEISHSSNSVSAKIGPIQAQEAGPDKPAPESADKSTENIAPGVVEKKDRKGTPIYVISKKAITLNHPIFAGASKAAEELKPSLILETKGGEIQGYVGLPVGNMP